MAVRSDDASSDRPITALGSGLDLLLGPLGHSWPAIWLALCSPPTAPVHRASSAQASRSIAASYPRALATIGVVAVASDDLPAGVRPRLSRRRVPARARQAWSSAAISAAVIWRRQRRRKAACASSRCSPSVTHAQSAAWFSRFTRGWGLRLLGRRCVPDGPQLGRRSSTSPVSARCRSSVTRARSTTRSSRPMREHRRADHHRSPRPRRRAGNCRGTCTPSESTWSSRQASWTSQVPRLTMRPVAGLPLIHVEKPSVQRHQEGAEARVRLLRVCVGAPRCAAGDDRRSHRHQADQPGSGVLPLRAHRPRGRRRSR